MGDLRTPRAKGRIEAALSRVEGAHGRAEAALALFNKLSYRVTVQVIADGRAIGSASKTVADPTQLIGKPLQSATEQLPWTLLLEAMEAAQRRKA